MFSEEAVATESLRVHLVHQRIGILRQAGCEDNHFVIFTHFLEEILSIWTLLHENIAHAIVNINRNHVVNILGLIELRVNKRLIEV